MIHKSQISYRDTGESKWVKVEAESMIKIRLSAEAGLIKTEVQNLFE